jgi:hypothetical protein
MLVRSLHRFSSRAHLRLCLNLLIILQYLLRLPKSYSARMSNTRHDRATGEIQYTTPDRHFEERVLLIKHLVEQENIMVSAWL